jgi:hypothetical protein
VNSQEYNKLISFASVYFRSKPHLSPEDIVNDVLLELLEADKPFMFSEIEKKIKSHKSARETSVNNMGKDFSRSDTERVCKDCKELLPVGLFYIYKQETKLALSSYCRKCADKRTNECKKTPIRKEQIAQYRKRYNDRVWAFERENLTDRYIIKCLVDNKKNAFTREFLSRRENYHIIEAHRKSVEIRRMGIPKKAEKVKKERKRLSPEEVRRRQKEYEAKNKEAIKEKRRLYVEKNREKRLTNRV